MAEREDVATALLLAMDGDLLPCAGMSAGNTDHDVPLNRARPKEVAYWAADAILASNWLAAHDERVRADERERLAGVREQATRAAAVYEQYHASAVAAPLGDPLRAVHIALGALADAVLRSLGDQRADERERLAGKIAEARACVATTERLAGEAGA